jgi:nucleoside-diphosphate-sugar epimerase
MSRVLVTGAGGFIGRAAVTALRQRGYEVHGAARTRADGVEVDSWHTMDLLDPLDRSRLVHRAGASHLLHLAWTTTHGRFWSDPTNLEWANASCDLVEAFAEAGGGRAVMSGSCAQYDWDARAIGPAGIAHESTTPRRPATLYGSAKQDASSRLEAWSIESGFSFASALLFYPYGPFDRAERLVPSVTLKLLGGEMAEVTSGDQVRDFVHVADCGDALAALVESAVVGAVNVGIGHASSVADVATTVARILDREDLLRIGAGDEQSKIVADVTRLREEVGFVPHYDLETGLRDTVDWWRSQRSRRR